MARLNLLCAVAFALSAFPQLVHASGDAHRGLAWVPPHSASIELPANWWESYDAAMAAIDESNWQAAITSLEDAIRQNRRSNLRARTYGMRFVAYFPYYFLGMAYFNLGQVDRAMEYLAMEQQINAIKASPAHKEQFEVLFAATEAVINARTLAAAPPPTPRPAPLPLPAAEELPGPALEPKPAPLPPPAPPLPRDSAMIAIVVPVLPAGGGDAVAETENVFFRAMVVDKYGISEITMELNGRSWDAIDLGGGVGSGGNSQAVVTPTSVAGQPSSSDGAASRDLGLVRQVTSTLPLVEGSNRLVLRVRNINGVVSERVRIIQRRP